MARKKAPPITTLHCPACGETVAGPDVAAVKATMARHTAKKHGKKKK